VKRFFTYDPEDTITFYDTAEEAKAEAKKILSLYADQAADEGWNQDVVDVCWGEVKESAVEVERKTRPPAEELDEGECTEDGEDWSHDEIVNYAMVPMGEEKK